MFAKLRRLSCNMNQLHKNVTVPPTKDRILDKKKVNSSKVKCDTRNSIALRFVRRVGIKCMHILYLNIERHYNIGHYSCLQFCGVSAQVSFFIGSMKCNHILNV